MYYRNPDYFDVEHLVKSRRTMPAPKPASLANHLILSTGMIVAPVVAFFLILGIGRLVAML